MVFCNYRKSAQKKPCYFNEYKWFTLQLAQKAYHHLSGADKIEALRQETILNIAAYVKEHPRARPNEIQMKVEDEINVFKAKLQHI